MIKTGGAKFYDEFSSCLVWIWQHSFLDSSQNRVFYAEYSGIIFIVILFLPLIRHELLTQVFTMFGDGWHSPEKGLAKAGTSVIFIFRLVYTKHLPSH